MSVIFFLHKKCENPQIETPCCLKRREGIFLTERIGVRQNNTFYSFKASLTTKFKNDASKWTHQDGYIFYIELFQEYGQLLCFQSE